MVICTAFAVQPAAGSTTGLSSPCGAKEKSKSFRVSLCRPLPIGREVYRAIPKFQEKLILISWYHLMFIHMFRFKVNIILIRSLPHVEFWAPLWLEKDSHETSHWKLEHPFNGLVSNSSRSISPFFGCLFSHHEAGEPVEPFHKRLCWSTMKGWKAELEFHCSIAASSNGLSMMSLCDVCNNDLCGMCAKNDWKDLKGPKCFATLA